MQPNITIYTVSILDLPFPSVEDVIDVEDWGAANRVNVLFAGATFRRKVHIMNDMDRVAFLLKYGHLVVNVENANV